MITLSIKTDQKISEVGLFKSNQKLKYINWEAHRELSMTIHKKIEELLKSQKLSWNNIEGIIFYEGPGSFTGLRIGASVANALASSLNIPVTQASGEDWIKAGSGKLSKNPANRLVVPDYGGFAHVSKPRK